MLKVVGEDSAVNNTAKNKKSNFDPCEIVTRINNGDQSAEIELINFYSDRLLYILTRKFSDLDICKDALQDTFIIVLNKIKNGLINDSTKLTAFIRSTAINSALMIIRKNKKYIDASDSNIINNLTTPELSSSEQIEQRQLATMVIDVINSLKNERDRTILTSFYISQLDKLQICQQLDITPNHFDKVIYRSKQRLKQLILTTNNPSFMTSISQWFRQQIEGTRHE